MVSGLNVAYELPPAVRSLRDEWTNAGTSAAVICGLLAVTESQLLVFVKDEKNFPQSYSEAQMKALLVLTYGALVFCISGAMSSFVLIDEFSGMQVRAARMGSIGSPVGTVLSSDFGVLRMFGARTSLKWVMYHWLFSVLASVLCTVAQVTMYVWLQESPAIQITVSIIVAFALLPLLYLVPCGQ
ncbi:hypothetical protein OF83DRAFT_526452 [Amylostereum chailletii]|nr:hypothetical protein OF83DRAFT_526452 [Amylostereum chailletii]